MCTSEINWRDRVHTDTQLWKSLYYQFSCILAPQTPIFVMYVIYRFCPLVFLSSCSRDPLKCIKLLVAEGFSVGVLCKNNVSVNQDWRKKDIKKNEMQFLFKLKRKQWEEVEESQYLCVPKTLNTRLSSVISCVTYKSTNDDNMYWYRIRQVYLVRHHI